MLKFQWTLEFHRNVAEQPINDLPKYDEGDLPF